MFVLRKNHYICLILLKIFIHVFPTNTQNLRYACQKICWELYTLENREIQIAMYESLTHCNDCLCCQKLPFLFSSEVYCFIMFNYCTSNISGFNLNFFVISSLWLPLLGFCIDIFSLFTSCCKVLHFFFFYDKNNSVLPKTVLRLN